VSLAASQQVVAEVLLRKGRQTFSELLRNINSGARSSRQLHLASSSNAGGQQGPTMTAGQLKQVLLVLIQQNCITIRQQPAEDMYNGRRPAMHIYEADLEQMLQLIRCVDAWNPNTTAVRTLAAHLVASGLWVFVHVCAFSCVL
jgi:hypothetical protein